MTQEDKDIVFEWTIFETVKQNCKINRNERVFEKN